MITPVIETERIILRPLKIADADRIYNNWTSDPEVARYMCWNVHGSVQDTVQWLAAEEENVYKETNYTWAFVLKENQEIFGSGGLNYHEEHGMFELGYNIMKKYWNRGFTTEAAAAIIGFAVNTLGVNTFLGRHDKNNPASGKVLEKIGFVYRNDGSHSSFDGNRIFETREYLLNVKNHK